MKLLKQGQANGALEKGKARANAAPDKPQERARGRRVARARMGAALSVVLAGTLVSGVCGGSLTSAVALAAEGSGGAGAASAPAAIAPADAKNATPKEEVVYARLSAAGAVDDVYVVNILKPDAPGTVTDFGDYQTVENLTDASGISQNGEAITANVAGDSLSYQGDLGAHALPWKVSIVYKLDGAPVEPVELGGATGALSVEITTKQDAMVGPAFFDNYLLQITVPFAAGKATDVATEDGQIALAGSDTQVTFTGMPGKDGSFVATAQVKDFEMSGITFAAVPFSMGIEAPDTEGLVSGFRQLGDGVGELKSGADGVASGAGSLASGAGQVAEGIGGLASGAGQLVGGANGLTEGAGQLAAGARDAATGAQGVADGAAGLAGGLEAYRGGLLAQAAEARARMVDTSALEQAYQGAAQTYVAGYAQAFAAAKAQGLDDAQAYQAAASATADLAASMQNALTAFMTATGGNAGAQGAADALDGAAAGLGAADDPASLAGGAAALAAGSAALVPGLSSLSEGAGGISAGAGSLASGASQLASGANQASVGAGELSGGASQLASGAQQLADGTGALYTEVQAIPDKVQQEIDAMMADYDKSDFKPISFASPKNTNVTLVQFVMSTDPIKAPIAEEPQSPEPEQSFWDRLLALFGL